MAPSISWSLTRTSAPMSRRLQVKRKQKAPEDGQDATDMPQISPPFRARTKIDVKQPGSATPPPSQALYGSDRGHSGSEHSVSDAEEPSESSELGPSRKDQEKARPERNVRTRMERANKHAPMEVSSKRPVTRRRTVVNTKSVQGRDPRFLPLVGGFSPAKFREQYGFLEDAHARELKTVRDHVKRAQALLKQAPNGPREGWEEELSRLELAKKKTESVVNQDRRRKIDQEALKQLAKEEKEKRRKGKKGWWMKESEKKSFLARARYDAIAASGGKKAVKKAIEKKQKKIAQKEKKSRPFGRPGGSSMGPGGKRPVPSWLNHDGAERKRRKLG